VNKRKVDYVNIITILAFIVMVIVVLLQVIFRYVMRISVPWTEEFARYLLILITFVGGALAVRDKQHIAVTAIIDKLPKKIRYYLNKCFNISIILFLVAVFKGSIIMVNLTWETPVGSISWLSAGKIYLILPISIVIMLGYLIRQLIEDIKNYSNKVKE
jgi:TRAP-type C4-dicarboxylate transport system permease small subunit